MDSRLSNWKGEEFLVTWVVLFLTVLYSVFLVSKKTLYRYRTQGTQVANTTRNEAQTSKPAGEISPETKRKNQSVIVQNGGNNTRFISTQRDIVTSEQNDKLSLEDIIKRCEREQKPFTDDTFPASDVSLFVNADSVVLWRSSVHTWKRISELSPTARLFVDDVAPGDIKQGELGDCWFLGALAAVATRKELLEKVIKCRQIEKWGVYEFSFYSNGKWETVIVDDYVPVDANGHPVFARSIDGNEMWVLLIEKAYAKLHGCCYENLEGGSELMALVDLTGGVPETFNLENYQDPSKMEQLWEMIVEYHQKGYLAGCAKISDEDGVDTTGIIQNHAYSVLDIQPAEKLIEIRNPWGDETELTDNLSETKPKPATFWISLAEYMNHFNRLYFVEILAKGWESCVTEGKWERSTSGGCYNSNLSPYWIRNPRYLMELSQDSSVLIVVSQKDDRSHRKQPMPLSIGFTLHKGSTKEDISMQSLVKEVTPTCCREVSFKFEKLAAGKYILCAFTEKHGEEGTYTISVYYTTPTVTVSAMQRKQVPPQNPSTPV